MSHAFFRTIDPARPSVILLNGCSGAGKTSIGRALQATLAPPHVVTGIDDFVFRMLPPQWHGAADGLQFQPQADGSVPLHLGPGAMAMERAFHRSVRALADCGLGVIVDDVILNAELLADWLDALEGVPVCFVGVHCALEELQQREAARPDRTKGHMQTHFAHVHAHGDYDLVVDTTARATWRCAKDVLAGLETWTAGATAFDRLRAAGERPPPPY